MYKTLLIAFLTLITLSCCPYLNQMPKIDAKIKVLQSENDSLKKILIEINKKHVLDSISSHTLHYRDRHAHVHHHYRTRYPMQRL